MKRTFLLFSMIACLCLPAAFGSGDVYATTSSVTEITEEQYIEYAEGLLSNIASLDDATINTYIASGGLPEGLVAAMVSWQTEGDELGTFESVISSEVTMEEELVTITVNAKFSEREGVFTLTMTPDGSSVTAGGFELVLTVGEIFQKAALNTVIGMGTVFVVLIFISFVISLFKYIPAIQDKFTKKPAVTVEEPVVSESEVIPAEELVDDGELVAVIMAAIYASMANEGKAVSKDSLIVRSIRRSRR